MMVQGGDSIDVYRGTKDRFGDKVTQTLVGTIDHVVFQWGRGARHESAVLFHQSKGEQETAAMQTVVYAPRNASVKLQKRDRFKLHGSTSTYQVVGDRTLDEPSPFTNHDFGYYMVQVELVA